MNQKDFDKLLSEIIKRTKKVLSAKNAEYATDADKLHNFKRAGNMLQCSPERALIGMFTKHMISILDIVDKIDSEVGQVFEPNDYIILRNKSEIITKKLIEEKLGDALNYLILLEALLKERLDE